MEYIRIAILNPYNKVLAFLDNTVPNAMHYFDETLHTYLKGSSYTFEFTTMTAHDDAVFLVCAGHGMSSVGDKPTTGSYRQV